MKNKNFLKTIIGLSFITLAFILLPTCKSGTEINANKAGFRQYITAYTAGIISKESVIKIKLISDFAKKIKKTDKALSSLFSFSPSIDGKAYWSDDNTIEFKPEKSLKSGEKYIVEFNLGKLAKVPDDLSEFIFDFETIRQNFDVEFDEIQTTDLKKFASQKVVGTLRTADSEKIENIKKMITAQQNGKELKIDWESDGTNHRFEIDNVKRDEKKSTLKVAWDGEKIEIDNKGETTIKVPSLSEFKVLFTKLVNQPEQYVFVQFSDPLDQNQDLEGLVKIQGIDYVRTIVDGNTLRVYPNNRLEGEYKLEITKGVQNVLGKQLQEYFSQMISFQELKPAVQLVGKGSILPSSTNGLVFPFEAVNLKAVDVQIIKIFESNVTQFLQVNNFEGSYQLERVGKPILRKTIKLDDKGVTDFNKWNRFSLDLNELIETEPGAIYRISIGFRKKHAIYSCGDAEAENADNEDNMTSFDEEWDPKDDSESSYWDMYTEEYYYDDYYYEDYDAYWQNRENPCHDAFYGKHRSVTQNIIASNLGLISKMGNNGDLSVFVTDMRTTEPLSEIEVDVLDYQNQVLATTKTNAEGKAEFKKLDKPYFVIAKNGKERGYLKINDGNSLSLSKFDVSGVEIKDGVKGFIYGERGVWRPGDSIYVTFILQEETKLPDKHPVVFELHDSRSQLVTRIIEKKNETGFYTFKVKTSDDAPTGNWDATVKVGGSSFYQQIKIETVKPNRLKIKLELEGKQLVAGNTQNVNMNVKWLHGAVAKNLKTKVDVTLSKTQTTFTKYPEFVFDDPTKYFESESEVVFEDNIDENGEASFIPAIEAGENAPGKLKATFVTRVFEKGGDFSIDQQTVDFSPFQSYVGLKLPKGDKTRGMLLTDKAHKVEAVVVSPEGKILSEEHELEFSFYKLDWRWWWDKSSSDLANYISSDYANPLKKNVVKSKGGKADWSIQINEPDWGRYLVRVKDLTSGHSSAKVVYIDWPGWAGRQQNDGNGATMLNFSSDKTTYKSGEEIKLTIPSTEGARALISIENGSRVLESFWVKTQKNQTEFKFKARKEMAPNIYVHVTMLQPHAQTVNDLPIRLYGIIPISIEDPETKLEPQILMAKELEAEKEFTVTVSEKDNKPMTYTLAVVDEGLLDLTRFKTPDPWNTFYAREAIGVKTWDIYDWVIGAFGNQISHLISIGGDDSENKAKNKKANRFVPVVKFLGPFTLKGGKKTHKIMMPRYVGSVRTMVIAGNNGAYGSAETTTAVTKPVMVIGTLPRVLGTGEKLKLPVNVFVMKDNIKSVQVEIKTNKLLKVEGSNKKTISFAKKGEEIVEFDINSLTSEGIATVEIIATSGNNKSTYEIELDVRNPNPLVNNVKSKILKAGETWTVDYSPIGVKGTNTQTIEVASIPPINLEKRIKELIQYPYGCVEQTTSSVFPQLYLSEFVKLDEKRNQDIERNIKDGIKRLAQFQHYSGGLGYWQNSNDVDDWGTCYAGHFMIEAQKKGYTLPNGFLDKWLKYQRKIAQNWVDAGNRSQFMQAYRLYTLALSGNPERGAMNRLRESKNLSNETKWRLAAAFILSGKKQIGETLVAGASKTVANYNEMSYTYGSDERDKAMILETLVLLGKATDAFDILKALSAELSSDRWLSTQTTAYSLYAIAHYVQKNKVGSQLTYSYTVNSEKEKAVTESKNISSVKLATNESANQKLTIKNTSGGILYVSLLQSGIPEVGTETSGESKLNMSVVYRGLEGDVLDVSSLVQGTEIIAEVSVKNPTQMDYQNIALSQIFPSGWEIMNTRLFNFGNLGATHVPTYLDMRDDRVYTYFDLPKGETKMFRIMLVASYLGTYYLPAQYCEAMYDGTIYSRQKGKWISVVLPSEI